MKKKFTRGRAVAAAALVGAVAIAGVAYATIPSNGVISACYTKSGGSLRVIDSSTGSCSSKETSLAWNVQGAQGPTGATGPKGANGPTGPAGPAGASGVSGYEVVSSHQTRTPGSFTDTNAFGDQLACPSGKVPVGGGLSGSTFKGNTGTGTADLLSSRPYSFSDPDETGWLVAVGKRDGTVFAADEGVGYTMYVICITAAN
jgi:hypothetical protein